MISLDSSDSLWTAGILFFLLGMTVGCIVTWLLSGRHGRTRQLQLELDELKERFTDYRDQVTQHFMRTSDLVQEMTQSYRAVYEHLANGAQHLCGEVDSTSQLSQQPSEKIEAKGIYNHPEGSDAEYDELTELTNIKNDIDELLGESPRISDLDIKAGEEKKSKLQH